MQKLLKFKFSRLLKIRNIFQSTLWDFYICQWQIDIVHCFQFECSLKLLTYLNLKVSRRLWHLPQPQGNLALAENFDWSGARMNWFKQGHQGIIKGDDWSELFKWRSSARALRFFWAGVKRKRILLLIEVINTNLCTGLQWERTLGNVRERHLAC